MIKFINEQMRSEFHLLPVERQLEFERYAKSYAVTGQVITIMCVERWGPGPDQSEVALRISKEFDPVVADVSDQTG